LTESGLEMIWRHSGQQTPLSVAVSFNDFQQELQSECVQANVTGSSRMSRHTEHIKSSRPGPVTTMTIHALDTVADPIKLFSSFYDFRSLIEWKNSSLAKEKRFIGLAQSIL
jgi:hypothetical protein